VWSPKLFVTRQVDISRYSTQQVLLRNTAAATLAFC